MRRFIFLVGLVAGVALAAYFYRDAVALFTKGSARMKAVPVESAYFFDVKGLESIRAAAASGGLTDKLQALQLYQRTTHLRGFFARFDTARGNPFFVDIERESVVMAAYPNKPGAMDMLYVVEMNRGSLKQLKSWWNAGSAVLVDERNVRGQRVYDVTFNDDRSRWSVGVWRDLCFVSRNTALVEQAIVQLKGVADVTSDKTFVVLKPSNSKAYLHLYVNVPALAGAAQGYADFTAYRYAQPLGRFASWIALAFSPANGGIAVQGKASTARNNLQALNAYGTAGDYKIMSLQQKPDNTALVVSTGIPARPAKDATAFYNAPDFQRYIAPWLDGEISYALVEPVDTAYGNQVLAFFRTENPDGALAALQPLNNASNDSLRRLPVQYRAFTVHQLRASGLIGNALPNPFTSFESPYYTVAGRYVVMSNSLTQLKLYLERFADGKTLDKVAVPGMNTASFARGAYNVYLNTALLSDLFVLSARSEHRQTMRTELRSYGSFSPVYLQFVPRGNGFDVEGFISSGAGEVRAAKASQYLWKTALDTLALMPPQPLGNGQKLIAVQDARYQLYMLNRGGNVMWRRQLDGPIMGRIHAIDFYKNNEQQYVFATTGRIYMIDKAGDPVQNFPIALPCVAATPLSVADLDNNRDYKYFVGCANGLIYGYEKGGKPLGGWNPNRLGADVTTPIHHFRHRSREFLLGVTDDGWLRFFTRHGDQAIKPMPIGNRSARHFVLDDARGYRAIAANGVEYRLGFDGTMRSLPSPMFDAADALLADVIPGKPGFEKILFDGKRIGVYSGDSTRVRTLTLPNAATGKLFVAQMGGGQYYVGVGGDTKVWLMSGDGKPVANFPRPGTGTFTGTDLYGNEQLVLIGLADDNTVVAYAIE